MRFSTEIGVYLGNDTKWAHGYLDHSMNSVPMTLDDLESQLRGVSFFLADLRSYARMV